jgi:signal transduction histidine kinase/DNA-binding response OmpR family regulator
MLRVVSSARAIPSASVQPGRPGEDADRDEDERALRDGPGILVVDDHHGNLVALEAALAPLGRELIPVTSAREALARLCAEEFGLVVLDVQMPDIDGFELTRLIRAQMRNRDTGIILVTGASAHDDAILRGYALGAVDFLVKPIHAEVLRAKARVFLQLQMRTTQLREARERHRDLEIARLYEAERVARCAAEAGRARAEFLARASAMFASSLQYEDTLAAVAWAAVPIIADWCAVDLVEGEMIKSVAVAHADPAKVALAKTFRQRYPPRPEEPAGVVSVLRTGTPQFHAEIPEALLAASARDAEQLRISKELGLRSAMLVPVKNQGATIGAITFVLGESARRYTEDDLLMAVQLGERAGVAIANARLYDEATKAVRLNELFSGVVGHDLRNPLASIMATSQLLLARGEAGDSGLALRRILSTTERMARMIDQLLDFTRIRAGGGLPSDPQPMDFAAVAHEVISELQVAHPEREITFAAEGSLLGAWDADRLTQLLSNLVSNAIEHGRPDKPVVIQADGTAPESIAVMVSNAGAVPPEIAPVVFEPFRGMRHRRTQKSGLGLGLYIAQQIALVHGGAIELLASDPQRTTFAVTLPRANRKASQR